MTGKFWPLIKGGLAVCVFLSSAGIASEANAQGVSPTSSAAVSDQAIDQSFARYVQSGTHKFDVERARSEGVDEFILAVGSQYNRNLENVQGGRTPGGQGVSFRAWNDPASWGLTNRWNWCGRDRTNGGRPVNSADAICMQHDKCLAQRRPVCDCDREFVNRMKAIKNNYGGRDRVYIEAAIKAVPRFHNC